MSRAYQGFPGRFLCCCLSVALLSSIDIAACLCADDNVIPTPKEREAIAALEKLGAKVNYQRKKPGVLGSFFFLYVNAEGVETFSDECLQICVDLPRLEVLQLDGTALTDEGLKHVASLPHISHLDLRYTKVTDNGLAHLSNCDSLASLSLDGTNITDAGLEHILDLKKLSYMSLSETEVTSAGANRIMELLPQIHYDVTKLDLYVDHGQQIWRIKERAPWIRMVHFLGGGVVDDSDLEQLSQIPGLQELIVSDSRVTDAGLSVLSRLKSLEYLDISDSRVRGPGLRNLHGLKRLKHVRMSGDSIDAESIDALKRKLPECEIDD